MNQRSTTMPRFLTEHLCFVPSFILSFFGWSQSGISGDSSNHQSAKSQSVSQSVNQSVSRPVGRSVSQSIGHSVGRSVGQLVNHLLIHLFICWVTHSGELEQVTLHSSMSTLSSYQTYLFIFLQKITLQKCYRVGEKA